MIVLIHTMKYMKTFFRWALPAVPITILALYNLGLVWSLIVGIFYMLLAFLAILVVGVLGHIIYYSVIWLYTNQKVGIVEYVFTTSLEPDSPSEQEKAIKRMIDAQLNDH